METETQTQPQQRSKLWTWPFIKVGIAKTIASCSIQVMQTVYPVFLDSKGFSATSIGTVASLYTSSSMIMRFASGKIVDTKGRRKVGILGAAIFALGLLGCLIAVLFEPHLQASFKLPGGKVLTAAMLIVIISRMIHGMGNATINVAATTMFADVVAPDRFAEGIGYSGLFNNLSTAIGPAIGIALIAKSAGLTFGVMLGVMLVSMAITNTMRYESDPAYVMRAKKEDALAADEPESKGIWNFFEKKAFPAAAIYFFVACANAATNNFLALYATSIGLAGVGYYYTIKAAFMILARVFSGRISVRLGVYRTIFLGLAISSLGYLGLSRITGQPMLYACAILDGLGNGFYAPSVSVLTLNGVPRKRRGVANSTYLVAWDLGVGFGAVVWGRVIDITGSYPIIFLLSCFVMLGDIVLSFVLSKKHPALPI